jgi:hypothetical protein
MVFVKASPQSEAEVMPEPQMIEQMTAYNEELHRAGVLLMADGLKPSKYGARINFKPSGETEVVDGPFTETKELVAGFWILECKSYEECLEWARRAPNPMPGYADSHTEVRPFFEAEDFADYAPELQARWAVVE